MSAYHHFVMSAFENTDLYVFNSWHDRWELASHYGSQTIYGVRPSALKPVKHFSIDYQHLDGEKPVLRLMRFREAGIRGLAEIDLTPSGHRCSRLSFFSEEDAVVAQALYT